MERVNLQEGWRFAKANSNEWTPVSVPGTVLSGLLEAGKMQDPYYREMNMKQESFWQRIMSLKLIFVFQRSN